MSFAPPAKKTSQINIALQLTNCWAKTYINKEGHNVPGRDVLSHCLIVGYVSRQLISRLPDWLGHLFFPSGSELIAATHDIGKVSPTFQEKIRRGKEKSSQYVHNSLPELKHACPENETNWGGHAGVSQATLKKCHVGKYIPEILGQHHGYSPNLATYDVENAQLGGLPWQEKRLELVELIKAELQCTWPTVSNSLHAKILSGLTTISDWIGSGTLFDDPTNKNWSQDINKALDDAGLILPKVISNLNFEDIFDFYPREPQTKLIEACNNHGVYILEAPMGIGKTEAALYAAYKMMEAGKAIGIYFALPTQLTSEKIHERMQAFLKKVICPTSLHRQPALIHSQAWLAETEMGEEGKPGRSWFNSKKRAILAPFGVGTVDQALMAVMHVKHGFVRTFGLAGKVVILDEVHSYDSYTGSILDTLVETLSQMGCTVIILSATLTQEKRRLLLGSDPKSSHYPLISTMENQTVKEIPVEHNEHSTVSLQLVTDERTCLQEALQRASEGQQVLWIENTVADAQKRYKILAANSNGNNIEVGLLHSRFIKSDRSRIEDDWVGIFGKGNPTQRGQQGRILVGTQILEQSLDLDADFLITQICPTDMLLQRLGRLWRHSNTIRPNSAIRQAWILSPEYEQALANPLTFGKSQNVYDPYILLRTLEVWKDLSTLSLPSQIRSLIEATYINRDEEHETFIRLKLELQRKKQNLESKARSVIATCGTVQSENNASARYSEMDSVEVLLISSIQHIEKATKVVLLDGKDLILPRNANALNPKEKRQIAIELNKNIVKVPAYLAPQETPVAQLQWLKDYLYIGKDESESTLRLAKISPGGNLLALDGITSSHNTYQLSYNQRIGFQAE